MWSQLSWLRDNISSSILTIPEPSEMESRTLRLRTANAVTSSKQLLPVIIALIEVAIRGESVREEIGNGAKDVKEKHHEYAALKKDENTRWAEEALIIADDRATEEGEKKEAFDAKKWNKVVSCFPLFRCIYLVAILTFASLLVA